jgi:hypothetical protein
VADYVEPGVSATDDRRPEFQRMIDAATIKPPAFDVILVHSFSRFFRDQFQLEFYVRRLAKNGVRLVSITQELGDDPMSNMIRQIMALFDEYQSKENAKHTLRAMKENARQGFSAPLSKYLDFHTRVCRPVGLSGGDRAKLCAYAIERIGCGYDLKNIIDLARYLVPLPVPQRWRRRMTALGSGDPTRLICSTLIAQAFEAVRYPILPDVTLIESKSARREILHIRHSSLYAPRDFDISPFFRVVKPTIENGFNYKQPRWGDLPSPDADLPAGVKASRRTESEPSRANSLASIEE